MTKFRYTAVAQDGSTVTGTESAVSAARVNTTLLERNLEPVSVIEKKSLLKFEITRKKVPRKELMHFSRQLGVFVKAGIPVIEALETMTDEANNKLFKKALTDIVERLQSGETLAGAAAAHPETFPPFYIGILASAEMTGRLDTVLIQLAEYIERDLDARRTVSSALVYPAIVMVMALVTVVVMAVFVLPHFKKFFTDLHAKLPLPTRMLLAMSGIFGTYWMVFLGLVLCFVVSLWVMARTDRGRQFRDRRLLAMPIVGDLVRTSVLERLCRILSSMVHAGVPLPDAIEVASGATNNATYRNGLADIQEAMRRGEGFAEPLAATGLFPSAARQMIRVGEETGTLSEQLDTAATYFNRELAYKIKRFTSLFEPAVIVMSGAVVGFVAIALVTAMYGIYNQVRV